MPDPIEYTPVNKRISRHEALEPYARFRRVGESIGYDKTFPNDIWEDENNWNNQNVWGS